MARDITNEFKARLQGDKSSLDSKENRGITVPTPILPIKKVAPGTDITEQFKVRASVSGVSTPDNPFESFINATYKSAIPNTVGAFQAAFGQFEAGYSRIARADERFPSEGVSGFVGGVVGSIIPTAGALLVPQLAIPTFIFYGIQAAGQGGLEVYRHELETGEDVGPGKTAAVMLGYGAAAYFTEKLGLEAITKGIPAASAAALKELGEAVASRSQPLIAKAFKKVIVPVFKATGATAAIEGLEEGIEQAANNVLSNLYKETPLLEGVGMSMVGGAIGGVILTPFGVGRTYYDVSQTVEPSKYQTEIDHNIEFMAVITNESTLTELMGSEGVSSRVFSSMGEIHISIVASYEDETGYTIIITGQEIDQEFDTYDEMVEYVSGLVPTTEAGLTSKPSIIVEPDLPVPEFGAEDIEVLSSDLQLIIGANNEFVERVNDSNQFITAVDKDGFIGMIRGVDEDARITVTVVEGVEGYNTLVEFFDKDGKPLEDETSYTELYDTHKEVVDFIQGAADYENKGIIKGPSLASPTHGVGEVGGINLKEQIRLPQDDILYVDQASEPQQRLTDRIRKAGLASQIVEVAGMIPSRINIGGDAYGTYEGMSPSPSSRTISLSETLSESAHFHELLHAYMDVLGKNDPALIRAGQELLEKYPRGHYGGKYLNGEEALADFVGRYSAGAVLNPEQESIISNFILTIKEKITDNLTPEEVAKQVSRRLLSRDPLQMTKYRVAPEGSDPGIRAVEQALWERPFEAEALRRKRLIPKYLDAFNKAVWESQNTILSFLKRHPGKLSDELHKALWLRSGATRKAVLTIEAFQKDIYAGLTPEQERELGSFIIERGLLARSDATKGLYRLPEFITPGGIDRHLAGLKETDPKLYSLYMVRANRYFSATRALLDIRHESGMITDAQYEKMLKTKEYVALDYLHQDEEVKPYMPIGLGPETREAPSADTRRLLVNSTIGIFQSMANNEAVKALYDFAVTHPDFNFAEVNITKVKSNWEALNYRVKGKDKKVYMPKVLAQEFKNTQGEQSERLFRYMGWAFGTPITKLFATGINPVFHIFSNPMLDAGRMIFSTNTYSNHIPVAFMELAQDLKATAKSAWTRKGLEYTRFVEESADGELLTRIGMFKTAIGSKFAQAQEFLGRLGIFTETWFRMAQMHGEINRNGRPASDAALITRESLDYSRGGTWIKPLSNLSPYLNPAVQGTRVAISYAWNNPKIFAYKMMQLGGIVAALSAANRGANDDDDYDDVPEYDKMNNFIIMTPLKYTDTDGNEGRYYIKLRKDQPIRPFAYVFEKLIDLIQGRPVPVSTVRTAASLMLTTFNIDPGAMPSTLRSLTAYFSNYDLWRGDSVWKIPGVRNKDEWTENTPRLWRFIGAITGMSPDRLRRASGSLVSASNPFINMTGFALEQMFKAIGPEERKTVTQELLQDVSMIKGLFGTTNKRNHYRDRSMAIREEDTTRKFTQNREIDRLSNIYYDSPTKARRKEITNFIRKQLPIDRRRLLTRFRSERKLHKIPNRDWWLSLLDDSPEVRAVRYYDRWANLDKKEQLQLRRTGFSIPGLSSPRFRRYLQSLIKGRAMSLRVE